MEAYMYCSNCGHQLTGKYCSNCGKQAESAAGESIGKPVDWSAEHLYSNIIGIPEVRELISKHASMAQKQMSGEQFLELFDKVIPLNIPLAKLGPVVASISAHLGVKTGKQKIENLALPAGTAIVAVLCSLARHGQTINQVHQFNDGCLFEAELPSDLLSWEGTLYISIRKVDSGCRVEVVTSIGGQLYDWGKSKRCIDVLISDLTSSPV